MWEAKFISDTGKLGIAIANWVEEGSVIHTYSRRIDGNADAAAFKAEAVAYKADQEARAIKNAEYSTALTDFLNGE